MEILALIAIGISGLTALVVSVPWTRYEATVYGRKIIVRNYMFREVIQVDGVDVANTRTGGDYITHANHTVDIEGQTVRIWIGTEGLSTVCRMDDGQQVLYQSGGSPPLLSMAEPSPAKEAVDSVVDTRIAAARVLLIDIANVDEGAATDLERALISVIEADTAARRSADAHATLGGSHEDSANLLGRRADAVDQVLATLRTLHQRVMDTESDTAPALATARDALARFGAAHEFDAATLS